MGACSWPRKYKRDALGALLPSVDGIHPSAAASAALENEIRPHKILINTMSAFAGTKLDQDIADGTFVQATEKENLEEEREFLSRLDLPDCYFWAVHPLDSVKIEGVLKDSKQQMLDTLSNSIAHVDESAINRRSRTGTL